MTETVTSAVAKKENGATATIERYRDDFAMVLPSHIKPDQWVRLSMGLFRRDQELAAIAERNPGSVLAALLDCARLGLEPGDTYHLVPFGNEIVGITDYTGLIELIYNAGAVTSVKTEIVYRGDLLVDPIDRTDDYPNGRPRFVWKPSEMDRPHHNPDWFSDRGEMIGAYAYAVMLDGSVSQVILMNRAEIEKVKDVSKTSKRKDSPWNVWPDRMWKKTVIRQLSKFVPTSAELRRTTQAQAERQDIPLPSLRDRQLPDLPAMLDNEDTIDAEVVDDEPTDVAPADATSNETPEAVDPHGDPGIWHDHGHPENGNVYAWHPLCTLRACTEDVPGKNHYYGHAKNGEDDCPHCQKEAALGRHQ